MAGTQKRVAGAAATPTIKSRTMNPSPEEPWRRLGQRRDCEPHRGPVLLFAARGAFLASCAALLVLPAPVALVLGTLVWACAWHDLKRMSAEVVDVAGMAQTASARGLARAAVTGTLAQVILAGLIVLAFYAVSNWP
jgi:hypothetical protein